MQTSTPAPTEKADTDGDGVGDNSDAFPTDPTETSDMDGDGTGDNADTDDNNDACPNEDASGADADGDGRIDAISASEDLILSLGLDSGTETSLLAKVDLAIAKYNSGDIEGAISILQALISSVEALADKKLTLEEAALLTGFADNAITQILVELYRTP